MVQEARERLVELSGDDWRLLMTAASRCLESNTEAINALNVFPVPDGDTGINMLLTMRALEERVQSLPQGASICDVTEAMAGGALLGARGNSGVILSQFFRGLDTGLTGCRTCSGSELAHGFQESAQAAYKAVGKPVEGTMLTVIRAAADAAARVADADSNVSAVWEAARSAAVEALARTPEQLPVLREAGVVDAGGQGMVALLEGGMAFLRGEKEADLCITAPAGGLPSISAAVSQEYLSATEQELYGYCTQFMVSGEALDVDAIRDYMATMADSAVVVGDQTIVKVHVHTFDPGPIISYAVSLGTLGQVKIDNIDEQHQEFLTSHRLSREAAIGVVAVAWGSGLENVFRNLGAALVVRGGQTMNPSTQELLDAVKRAGADCVLLLPNNPNVIPAAQQAAQLSDRPVHVVPTRTIPQGIAALLAFNPEQGAEANASAMAEAAQQVRTGEVTTAIRSTRVKGRPVQQGQAIGFLGEEMVSVADTPLSALQQVLERARPTSENLVTLYWGGDLDQAQADAAAQWVREHAAGAEVELVHGRQPYYHFILSIE